MRAGAFSPLKALSVCIHILANRNQRNRNAKIKTLGNNILQAKVTVGHALSARRCNSTLCLYRLNSDSVMEAKNSTAGRDQRGIPWGRMRGDNALCSSAALINSEYPAQIAGNFAMKGEGEVEGSNPTRTTIQSSGFGR